LFKSFPIGIEARLHLILQLLFLALGGLGGLLEPGLQIGQLKAGRLDLVLQCSAFCSPFFLQASNCFLGCLLVSRQPLKQTSLLVMPRQQLITFTLQRLIIDLKRCNAFIQRLLLRERNIELLLKPSRPLVGFGLQLLVSGRQFLELLQQSPGFIFLAGNFLGEFTFVFPGLSELAAQGIQFRNAARKLGARILVPYTLVLPRRGKLGLQRLISTPRCVQFGVQ
jgi:hypothetical protein